MKKIVGTICFALLAFSTLSAQETKRVLFIGNSYTEVNNLPDMVQRIASEMGDRMEYRQNTPGGCTFRLHLQNESLDLIRQGGWDVVVLQEQSQLPSFPPEQVARECFPYAAQLVEEIYDANPDGEAMFYMTWGRRNGDAENGQIYPPLATYEGMDSLLYERYMYMAEVNDASVCPVGRVWRRLRESHAEIELYADDGSHPSMAGTYAAATAFYTMIFRQSPENITYHPDEVDDMTASVIRQTVQRVVYDSLSFWLRRSQDTTQTDTTQTDTVGIALYPAESTSFALHPNPCQDKVTVTVDERTLPCTAELYTLDGRKITSWRLTESRSQHQLKGLPTGDYVVKVRRNTKILSVR